MLSCEHNLLEKLPDHLPNKLDQLICSNNKLKYLFSSYKLVKS